MHNSSLTPSLAERVAAAVRAGESVRSVLTAAGVDVGEFYDWLKIADGRMRRWRDGSPISARMRSACQDLCERILLARIAGLEERLAQVRERAT